ncbi:uncharacterized protein [Henckelia pumila]|uniref:uncharacterized protein isoform X2 n=1 Tax=Henckelia pumila TaxID=405737 RepID=UPI003C6DCE9D
MALHAIQTLKTLPSLPSSQVHTLLATSSMSVKMICGQKVMSFPCTTKVLQRLIRVTLAKKDHDDFINYDDLILSSSVEDVGELSRFVG